MGNTEEETTEMVVRAATWAIQQLGVTTIEDTEGDQDYRTLHEGEEPIFYVGPIGEENIEHVQDEALLEDTYRCSTGEGEEVELLGSEKFEVCTYTVLLDMHTDKGERAGLARLAQRMAADMGDMWRTTRIDSAAGTEVWEERVQFTERPQTAEAKLIFAARAWGMVRMGDERQWRAWLDKKMWGEKERVHAR